MQKLQEKLGIKSPLLFKLMLAGAVAVLLVLGVVYMMLSRPDSEIIIDASTLALDLPLDFAQDYINQSSTQNTTAVPTVIVVYVSGHVRNPGVFEFSQGARIWQAIEAAGGMTENADENAINLADEMFDTQHIIVFGIEDNMPPSVAQSTTADGGGVAGGLVNINTATAAQLQSLSQIGDVRAQNIIRHREARGGFATIYEIMNVTGISDGIFEQIRDYITVGTGR